MIVLFPVHGCGFSEGFDRQATFTISLSLCAFASEGVLLVKAGGAPGVERYRGTESSSPRTAHRRGASGGLKPAREALKLPLRVALVVVVGLSFLPGPHVP